jgi:glycosyltransferase involved in cell wall biosynthesis
MTPLPTPEPAAPIADAAAASGVEVSFVMPCLNEAETIERCVLAARRCISENGLRAEVIVADNGSTDGSPDLARRAGARVVPVAVRGVGAAITAGVEAARGRYIIMGDSDLQHDFAECFPFVERLRRGDADLVMGTRLRGTIRPGAMRTLNRYVGNPVLTFIGRVLFRAPVSDFHCGLRAFPREQFLELNLRTVGFEFTTEHIAKAALRKQRIVEIPITVHPEGRSRPPHLKPFGDGWRTLRFMLLLSPRWTLVIPGLAMMAVGAVVAALVAAGPVFFSKGWGIDIHSLVLGCMLLIVGYMAVSIGAAARIYAIQQEIGPPAPYAQRLFSTFTLERGLIAGGLMLAIGGFLVGRLAWRALTVHLRPEDVFTTLRPMVIGATLIALGAQTVLMSFFYSMLGVPHRARPEMPPPSEPRS